MCKLSATVHCYIILVGTLIRVDAKHLRILPFEIIIYSRDVTFDKDITPFIHVFIYHCAYFAMKYGPLKAFEMEQVEQLNYVNKLVFFGSSNKGKETTTVTEQVPIKSNPFTSTWGSVNL